jgi:hypothetical protein
MIGALSSFFGGTLFRVAWGEIANYFNKRQDHAFELERLKLQNALDSAQHARNLEALKLQADLGVRAIDAQRDADIGRIDANTYLAAVEATKVVTGVRWVDAWNASIRPAGATIGYIILICSIASAGWVVSAAVFELVCGMIGLFFGGRIMEKQGK